MEKGRIVAAVVATQTLCRGYPYQSLIVLGNVVDVQIGDTRTYTWFAGCTWERQQGNNTYYKTDKKLFHCIKFSLKDNKKILYNTGEMCI